MEPDRLSGWKEIAQHLRRSVRSVQRWERELHLPIKRVKTAHGQVVFASRAELDAWMARFDALPDEAASDDSADDLGQEPIPLPEPVRLVPLRSGSTRLQVVGLLALVTIVAAVGVGFGRVFRPDAAGPAATVLVSGRLAEGRDAQGQLVWSHAFSTDVFGVPLWRGTGPGDASLATDLNGDGTPERLVAIRYGSESESLRQTDAVYAFSASGDVLWSATLPPDAALTCGDERFSGPWQLGAVAVSEGPGPKRVWVSFNHRVYWPSMVVEITPDGQAITKYIQAGWVMGLAAVTSPEGLRVAAAGVMNGPERASVVTFDPSGRLAIAPTTDRKFSCVADGAVPPTRVTLFPPLDVTLAHGYSYYLAGPVAGFGEGLKVDLNGGSAVALTDTGGTVAHVSFSDGYWLQHAKQSRAGLIDHPPDACPHLTEPWMIQAWTPAGGWTRYEVAAKGR